MSLEERTQKAIPSVKNDSHIDSLTGRQAATPWDTSEQAFLRPSSAEAR
jgi:hypothetical protein